MLLGAAERALLLCLHTASMATSYCWHHGRWPMPKIDSLLSHTIPIGSDIRMEVNPFTLAFNGRCAGLEKSFLTTYALKSLPQVRLALILGVFIYASFGILDTIMAEDLKIQFWYVRFGIVCPSILLVFLFSFSPHFPKYMQGAIAALILISGLGIIYMTMAGNVLMVRTYYAGLMLVLVFAYTFIRARFIWSTPACWLVIVFYIGSAIWIGDLPTILLINNAFFCMAANILGMLVCYSLEYYARRDFFMGMLLEEQHKKVAAAKDVLELKVQQRTALLAQANDELRREIQAHQRLNWEKKSLEDQLRQAQKMEAVGTLAGGIAHDFNNILAAIMGHTELAQMQIQDPEQAEICLTEVLSASDRAKDLVGQILAFSRHSESELKPLQVSSVIKEALRLMRATLSPSITINQYIQAANSIVVADATQIHQILMNLCTNAAHAMNAKGGTLTVELTKKDITINDLQELGNPPSHLGPGQYVCLSVSDTGHGIPGHLLERIFDPYFTTKAKGVGTGLGLAVVRGIVQNHGGIIDVQSKPGRGTTFQIYLPRVEGQSISEIKQLKQLRSGSERILLVDDESGLAELGAKLLSTLGYRVVSYSASQEALDAFRATPHDFDLLITDMVMPYINGKELASKVLALRPDLPVIIYTGFSDTVAPEEIKRLGVKAILRKPITIYGLSQAIRRVLEDQQEEEGEG